MLHLLSLYLYFIFAGSLSTPSTPSAQEVADWDTTPNKDDESEKAPPKIITNI